MKDDSRVQMFRFRNTYGMLDSIYASGAITRDVSGTEYRSFINGDTENETSNDFKEKYITDTGYLGTRAMIDYWADFFRSSEHYVWKDGSWVRIILDDVPEGESTFGQVSSFKFSWHLATQPTGRVCSYPALEPYQYERPE